MEPTTTPQQNRVRVVIATTVMLSFISFWRAAAIVLNDLGSSAFYVGGIAEEAAGRAAPWLVLGVMLFSYAVRAVYVESCAMFTRGGVYRVVKEAMGGTLAKISVSALMFDYVLTGPISGVSAGQYIVGLVAQTMTYFGHPWQPDKSVINLISAGIAIFITLYFWWRNIQGMHESSSDALQIMKITTVMVVIMIFWCSLTLIQKGITQMPPPPTASHMEYSKDAIGWMPKIFPKAFYPLTHTPNAVPADPSAPPPETRFGMRGGLGMWMGVLGIMIAFGHAVLAMSGEESLAQVNRELEYPKHKNLMRAGFVIFVYSLIFTSLVSIFASMIIPDSVRPQYFDNLISGLSMYMIGPLSLRLLFQAFVVFVGFLMLSGAVNTAIVGSNGVLNRLSEDGVLTSWFRKPQKKYGTTYRMINLIVFMQLLTIVGSHGDVYMLGEAYAFGVVWSFAFKGLAMVVLRYKDKSPREWKVPGNLYIGTLEIPFGLILITSVLLFIAVVNIFTKEIATISGIAFTCIFYTVFAVSEYINHKRVDKSVSSLEQFNLSQEHEVSLESVQTRPGNILVAVHNYNLLAHLEHMLDETDTVAQDVVVTTIRLLTGPDSGERDLYQENLFRDYEQRLFTAVVNMAEKHGKHVDLLVVPSNNIFDALAQTAVRLDSAEIVTGLSAKMNAREQEKLIGQAWERLPQKPRRQVQFKVVDMDGFEYVFNLGAHAPQLSEEDINMVHSLWLDVQSRMDGKRISHGDVMRVALQRLKNDLNKKTETLDDFKKIEHKDKKP